MSKKIKALVQKYEKDMKFENRFDELKDKLDLIPDVEVKNEVFVIKRKVMPAYVMIIVLLMLVTGLIGLQFGLNNDLTGNQQNLNEVDKQLMNIFDLYERESVQTIVINDDTIAYLYVGFIGTDKYLVARYVSSQTDLSMDGTIDNNEIIQTSEINYVVGKVENDIVNVQITFHSQNSFIDSLVMSVDLSSYYDWLME